MTFGKEMKKRRWRVIGWFAVVILLAIVGLSTFERIVQIDLQAGTTRTQRRIIGLTFYNSPPESTTMSLALKYPSRSSMWLTIASEGFSFPRTRIDFCHPRMFFWIGAIDRSFANDELTSWTARTVLAELADAGDVCVLKTHLKGFWNHLAETYDDSWPHPQVESEASRIWKTTKKPNKAEIATPSKPSD